MGCITSKQTVSVTPALDCSGAFKRQSSSAGILASSSSSSLQKNRSHKKGSERDAGEEDGRRKSRKWLEGSDPWVKGFGDESGRSRMSFEPTSGGNNSNHSHSSSSVSFRLGNISRYVEGEQVAAGWPAWLSAVASEAIRGWVPLKADSFEKLEKVGQGTYSSVFKARDLETGKTFALKKVRFDNFEPESVRFMAREIQILRRLDHPNVMKLEGLITSRLSCSLYLVFEYMEHDLSGLSSCPNINFTESQVKCYMHQLLSGIEHCHSRGVMHRDIKGANLLVNNEGVLKVADFGLANYYNSNQKHPLTSRVVTLWYRPPELLLGSTNYGTTVDLWSVGCVFAEMLLRKPLLQGRTEVEQLHKIFKLCGSPPDEYWRKSKLPHTTMFKPHQSYEGCLEETLHNFPFSAVNLIRTLLSIEPHKRGTASTALASEYFKTKPYACDPSSLPKYPPNKEIDAKAREDELRRKIASGRGAQDSVAARRGGSRINKGSDNVSRFVPHQGAHDANDELHRGSGAKVILDKRNRYAGVPLLKSTMDLPEGTHHRKKFSQEDVPISGPLPVSGSSGFEWAKREGKDITAPQNSHRRTRSRVLTSGSLDYSSSPLKPKDFPESKAPAANGNHVQRHRVSVHNDETKHRRRVVLPDSFDSSDAYHSQDFSSALYQKEDMAFKQHIWGFRDDGDKVDFSGPILSNSPKVDELLRKNERHIRQAVRRSWFQRGKRQGRQYLHD